MRFTKMQACGNDFVVVNGFDTIIPDPGKIAERVCDRHFGIGADGLIIICPSSEADVRMRIINADGGEVNMCGNGIRCAAKFAYDHDLCHSKTMRIETGAGILAIEVETDGDDKVIAAKVDMGVPDIDPAHYPLDADDHRISAEVDGLSLNFFCVNTGVPHAVTFDIFPEWEELKKIGPAMEHYRLFPKRSNVCFARVGSDGHIDVRVWERGCGITLACGTGSCAVLFAGHAMGLCDKEADIVLPGGTLHDCLIENGHVTMIGPAVTVFEGEIEKL